MRNNAMRYETVRPASAYYDLARLISPIGVDEFFEEYYERQPLLVKRSDRSYYQNLYTLADLDQAMMVANLRADMTRVVIDGVETPLSELLKSTDELARGNELEMIYQRYREGFTVVINTIDERHEGLKQLCRTLDNDGGFNPQVNLYLTPPEQRGFRPHYDTHDVFMVQVYGSKKWSLLGAPAELPTRNQRWRTPEDGPGEPTMEFTLEAGDVVYLPRGTVHAGTSTDEASLHVTIGLHPVLWADVFKRAVREVVEGDVAFRRSLPVGYTHDTATRVLAEGLAKQLAVSLAEQLPAPESIVSDSVWERVVNQRHPEMLGHLVDLQQVGSVGADTVVRRRPEVQALFGVGPESVSVAFNGKSVEFPARVGSVVRDVVERDGAAFTPAQIAGDLDEAGRIVLVTMLLKEGYLTLA